MKKKSTDRWGHNWAMNGDVSQCTVCGTYLGIWDGVVTCAQAAKKKLERQQKAATLPA